MSDYLKYLIIAIAGIFIYSASLDYDAVKCDDTRLIEYYNNAENTNSSVLSEFSDSYLNTTYYRPLVNISFRIDAELWGSDASKYHRLNILFHIVFCTLLFITVKRLSGSDSMALLSALIYSVHPLFANAVAWIPGRNDLMLGTFGLSSFLFFDNYLKSNKTKDLILNVVLLLLALFSKETAVILPVLFFVYSYIDRKEGVFSKPNITLYFSWLVAGIIWFVLRSMAEKGTEANLFGFDIFIYNLRVLPEYLGKFFIPLYLSVLPTYSSLATIIGSIILLLLTGGIFLADEKNKKQAAWGLLWFMLLILPTTIFRRGNADEWNDYLYCRSYLPLTGIIMMLSFILKDRLEKIKPVMLLSVGLVPVLLYGYANIQHHSSYTSPVSFYDNAIEQDSSRAYYYQIIGNYYMEDRKFDEAEHYFEKAAENQPSYSKRYFQLGEIAMLKKEYSKAITQYKKSLELDPNDKRAMFALSQAFVNTAHIDSAKVIWNKMTELFPDEPDAYFVLFNIAVVNGDYDKVDEYGSHIISRGFQNAELSGRINKVAQKAFQNKSLEEAAYLWKYAYAVDTANIKLLQYITGSYFVAKNLDSTKKYYNFYRQKGGNFSDAEEQTYNSFLK